MPPRSYTQEQIEQDSRPIVLPWSELEPVFANAYQQGEHIALVGPTGGGKTTVGLALCKTIGNRRAKDGRPARVTVLCSKPRDDTMREILPESEWPIVKKWPPEYGQEHCIVWVRGGDTAEERFARQRRAFKPLLDRMYNEGGQTVYIPEASHFERKPPNGLGMSGNMTEMWTAARSNKLALISDTQRPRFVTRSMWTEPSWLIVMKPDDEEDLAEVAKLSGRKVAVWTLVPQLGPHEFLLIGRQKGMDGDRNIYVSRIDVSDVTRNNRNNKAERSGR